MLVTALVAWWWWRSRGDSPAPAKPQATVASEPAPETAAATVRKKGKARPTVDQAQLDSWAAKRAAMVEHAKALNRFPPDSQPLVATQLDLIQPYSRYEVPVPLPLRPGEYPDPDDQTAPYLQFTGPRYLLTGDTPLVATLEVFKRRPQEGQLPERLPVEIVKAELLEFGQPDYQLIETVPMNDHGRDGDPVADDHVASVVVELDSLPDMDDYNGMLMLKVEFRIPNVDHTLAAQLDFMMTAAPPAVFTGNVKERLVPQGLELSVELDVRERGYFFTQILLFDATDKPIGYAMSRNTWEVGKREAVFLFFGLLFHDAQAVAPYVARTFTGGRLPEESEPFKIEIPPYQGEYRTKTYKLSDFSDAEWESPDKDKLIQQLEDLAAQNPDKTPVPAAP